MSREHGRRFCLAMAILLSVLAVMFFLAWSRQRKRIEPKPPLHIEGITQLSIRPDSDASRCWRVAGVSPQLASRFVCLSDRC